MTDYPLDSFTVPATPASLLPPDAIPLPPDATATNGWHYNDTRWERLFDGPTFTATGTPQPCYCCDDYTTTAGSVTIAGGQLEDGTTYRWIEEVWIRPDADAADACALAAALLNAADHLTQTHSPRPDAPTGLSEASNHVPEEFPQCPPTN